MADLSSLESCSASDSSRSAWRNCASTAALTASLRRFSPIAAIAARTCTRRTMSASVALPVTPASSAAVASASASAMPARPCSASSASKRDAYLASISDCTPASCHLGLPTLARRSSCAWQSVLIAACAASNACSMTSSDTSLAPASTIVMASIVPHTIRSRSESSICVISGLTLICPSMRPMRTAPTGPKKGSGEMVSAAEAPLMASVSWLCSPSIESTVPMICTSLRKPLGQSGRIGRSTMRAFSVAFSEALPSRLKKPPGILPAAYIFSSISTVRGKKSVPSRASLRPTAVASTTVAPLRTVTAPWA